MPDSSTASRCRSTAASTSHDVAAIGHRVLRLKKEVLNSQRCILIVRHDERINKYANRIVHMEDGCIAGLDQGTQ